MRRTLDKSSSGKLFPYSVNFKGSKDNKLAH